MVSEENIDEIPFCIDELEDTLYYLPSESDVAEMKNLLWDGNYSRLHEKAREILKSIEEAQNALSNIVYLSREDV